MLMDKSSKILLFIISITVIAVVIATAYKFVIKKDYLISIETQCNTETETCFYRDCSNSDDCPPNQLEYYKVVTLSAADIDGCLEDSCVSACASGSISCEELSCGESDEDECVSPEQTIQVEDKNATSTDSSETDSETTQ
jgi:hypothetical protein